MERAIWHELPSHLHDADRLLMAYGKWSRDRPAYGRCGSAEGRYRSTDVHHGAVVPVVVIPDWSAAEVQRSLNAMPERWRLVLTAWYVPSRAQQARIRRIKRGMGWAQFREMLCDALTMFRNIHRG